eukprot:17289-Heterococcus_DN1.PRE.1
MNVHTVAPEPPPRCPLCTLRQPCSNCSYDIARAALVATCTAAAATVSDNSSQLATAQALLQLSPSKGNSRSSIIANKNFAAVMTTAARRELEALTTALHEIGKIKLFVEAVAQWASTSGSLIAVEYQVKAKDVAVQLQRVLK